MQKILIIRFSSIGDIVLTTPVIRCLKEQLPKFVVHYVTKDAFKSILESNPYIDKLHSFKKDVSEIYSDLISENYDLVIDLHKNLRSLRLKQQLKTKSYSFKKLNVQKFLAVNFKLIKTLPTLHIVDRYLETVAEIGVKNDHKGLDFFLKEEDKVNTKDLFFSNTETKFIALVVGGSYYTKKIPVNKLKEICASASLPVIVLGGHEDISIAKELKKEFSYIINACGIFSINQSASLIQQAEWVITSDTGLMHIASAFNKKIITVWGNTIPEFGMGPYLPNTENKILEIKSLSCRPCSKLGYKKCPKDHFKCMNDIDYSFIKKLV
ncbi:glycosyltransferase family 9 protein [Aurantibacillus circumpalustris]|uniref:glycosyltransferase family 9 protein n=1 Tax=Aurantibacillus circumpalustris TaxID=3036359 RepID=UPI00295BC986|nr:glycosyltransferase family 9 protein [Aurantibacillus circumpalustris]